MKFAITFLVVAVFALTDAQPLFIGNLVKCAKDKLDNPDYEPWTFVGKAAKKLRENSTNKDKEALTLAGKPSKKVQQTLTDPHKGEILLPTKIIINIAVRDGEKNKSEKKKGNKKVENDKKEFTDEEATDKLVTAVIVQDVPGEEDATENVSDKKVWLKEFEFEKFSVDFNALNL